MAIELIKEIEFAPVNKIIQYLPLGNKVSASAYWITLPMLVTSGQISFASKQDAAGVSYTTNLSARFKSTVGPLPHGIFKIELCSGRTLIIGTPDIPVRPNENISLSITTFTFSHNSINAPLELILEQ